MGIHYSWEKFFAGTLTLAQGSGTPAQRLAAAFNQIGRLKLGNPQQQEMPNAELEARFNRLYDSMTAHGSYDASAAAMDELTVHQAIEEVVSIFNALAGAGSPRGRGAPLMSADNPT
jgi:hypothetical protein